jgi:hypothetical protein
MDKILYYKAVCINRVLMALKEDGSVYLTWKLRERYEIVEFTGSYQE